MNNSNTLIVGKFYKTNYRYFMKDPSKGVVNSQLTTDKLIMYLGIHEYNLGWSDTGHCLKFLMDGKQIIYCYVPNDIRKHFHEAKAI